MRGWPVLDEGADEGKGVSLEFAAGWSCMERMAKGDSLAAVWTPFWDELEHGKKNWGLAVVMQGGIMGWGRFRERNCLATIGNWEFLLGVRLEKEPWKFVEGPRDVF